MFGLFSPRCPVSPRERVAVERGLGRLVDLLDREWVRRTVVMTRDDFAEILQTEPIAAGDLATRMEGQFPFPVNELNWVEEPDLAGQAASGYVPGETPTGVVPHQPGQSPEQRVALVARCLCQHAASSRPELQDAAHQLPLAVDLLAVLSGLGVFAANSSGPAGTASCGTSSQTPQLFMPSRQFGYALAVRCFLCDESSASWADQLRPDAREPFELGLKFLRKRRPVIWDAARDDLRSFRNPPPAEEVLNRLRNRDVAIRLNALCDIAEYATEEPAILREVEHLLHDHSDDVREEAIGAIVRLDSQHKGLNETLLFFAEDRSVRVRRRAAAALGTVSHPPENTIETLSQLTSDAEPGVSAAAAESLLAFPEGLSDHRPRVFRVLRQQLARCNYDSVDRFMHRLQALPVDAASLIRQEFASEEEETWQHLLLQSLEAAGPSRNGSSPEDESDPADS